MFCPLARVYTTNSGSFISAIVISGDNERSLELQIFDDPELSVCECGGFFSSEKEAITKMKRMKRMFDEGKPLNA